MSEGPTMRRLGGIVSGLQCRLPIVVGVTGHRDFRPQDARRLEDEVRKVLGRIRTDYLDADNDTPLIVMSSLAEGADQLVARIALECGAGLVAPLPMPAEEYRKDFRPEVEASFDRLLSLAIAAPLMPLAAGNSPDDVRDEPARRALQYRAAGLFIIRHSHILLTLWDGRTADMKAGGTAEIVSIKRNGFSVETCTTARDCIDTGTTGPVIVIRTPRQSRPEDSRGVATELWGKELISAARRDPQLEDAAKVWRNAEVEIGLTVAYNRDAKKLLSSDRGREMFRQSLEQLFDVPQGVEPIGAPLAAALRDAPLLCATYALSDVLARHYQTLFRNVWKSLFLLALLMAIAIALSSSGASKTYLLVLYQMLFVGSFILYFFARRRQYQGRYLDYRALSETARTSVFWRIAGLEKSPAEVYPVCQPDELGWVRLSLQSLDCFERKGGGPLDALRYRICRDIWIRGQYDYFRDRVARHMTAAKRSKTLSLSLVGVATIGTAAISLSEYFQIDWKQYAPFNGAYLTFVLELLPAIGAAMTGYVEQLGQTAQALQFDRMRSLFGQALAGLPESIDDPETEEKVRALLEEVGREAVQESASWISIFRLRPLKPVS